MNTNGVVIKWVAFAVLGKRISNVGSRRNVKTTGSCESPKDCAGACPKENRSINIHIRGSEE